jgi:glycosyltransferase involved in cell wall biosynthesis
VKVLFYVDTGGSTGGPGMHSPLVYRAFRARFPGETGPFAFAASEEDRAIFARQLGDDAVVPLDAKTLRDGGADPVETEPDFYAKLCALARAHGCDHVHVLWGFVTPSQVERVPPSERLPVTVTLCDATGRGEDDEIDQMYFGSERWERYLRDALRLRAGYFAISEKTRRDALAKGVSAEHVETHLLWVAPWLRELRTEESEGYLLYVGGIAEYKGISHVLDFALLYPEHEIRVAGYPFDDFPIDWARYPSIRHLGYLPSYRDVAVQMSRAKALLYLSYSEGFGLPMIEAQTLGTPLLVNSRNRMVQELLPRGSYVAVGNVSSPSAIQAAVTVAARDRAELRRAGFANAERFDEARQIGALRDAMARENARQRKEGLA